MMKVAVVGSGIAGIASAIRLACEGHTVSVFEANSYPGGKLSTVELGDFRFDAGPSLFTMPQYIEELFELAEEPIEEYFEYEAVDPVCKYFWEDGTKLSAYSDEATFGAEVEAALGVSPAVLSAGFEASAYKYKRTSKLFMEQSLHRWQSFMNKETVIGILNVFNLDIFKTMHDTNERLYQHPKLVQLFDRYATYNGSNPYEASGILNIIPHIEHSIGAFFPKGGMHSITTALVQLAKKKGVSFELNQRVERIVEDGKRVTGVHVDGQDYSFDVVVSNMDIYPTYQKLLPKLKMPKAVVEAERSSSGVIFYWGINRSFDQLDLHNILFAEDYEAEFEAIFKDKEIYHDPTVYINITSKYNKKDAPGGMENWFVMVNTHASDQQDWESLSQQIKKHVLAKIKRTLGVDISPHIVEESVLDPSLIASKTSSYKGALYGTSSNTREAAFLRHPNFSKQRKGLYFCGGSVHPGGGIPLCLQSARITAELIAEL